jgi:hypothetical protein
MLAFTGIHRTRVRTEQGMRDEVTALVAFDKSYATGGESIGIRDLGLKHIDKIEVHDTSGYRIDWNRVSDTDHRLRVYLPTAATTPTLTIDGIADTTALKVVYWNPVTKQFTVNGASSDDTANASTSAASVAVEVAAGTDLSALKNVACVITGW